MTDKINTQQIFETYKKFKNYCYYDNSSMFTRKVIADFENEFFNDQSSSPDFKSLFEGNKHIVSIKKILNDNDEDLLNNMLNEVTCRLIPKSPKVKDGSNKKGIRLITNVKGDNTSIEVESVNAIIDAPLEIHLISVLWLMIVGIKYANEISENSYANQFELKDVDTDEQRMRKGYHLYKPYYSGYQDWRDKAMKEAERLLDEDRNATIVSLDIKRFYYSVRINLPKLLAIIDARSKNELEDRKNDALAYSLTSILQRVHEKYNDEVSKFIKEAKINESKEHDHEKYTVLPVGLISSGFIANLYLTEFDFQVSQRLKSSYYGRYVDDMLFVFPDMVIGDDPDKFIKEVFVQTDLLRKTKQENESKSLSYKLKDYKNLKYDLLTIQNEKIVIEHFNHKETKAALKKFISNLSKKRSEFRFIPEEEDVENDFDNSAFNLQYSDSINKFRSITDFEEDKYGASSYLAHKIYLSCYTTSSKDKNDKESKKQILQFFTGKTAIFFYLLWDKVSMFYNINNDLKDLRLFAEHIVKAIESIQCDDSQMDVFTTTTEKLRSDMKDYLAYSLATSLATYPRKDLFSKDSIVESIINKTNEYSKKFRSSNLFSHSRLTLSSMPASSVLLDFSKDLMNPELEKWNFAIDNETIQYFFPRFLHYDEISVLEIYKTLLQKENSRSECYNIRLDNVSYDINKVYNKFNYRWQNLFSDNEDEDEEKLKYVKFVKENHDDKFPRTYITIRDDNREGKDNNKFRVAIANMKTDTNLIKKIAIGKPNLTLKRRAELFSIINSAIKNKADMLILPELSVPYQWISLLTQQCKKNHLAIVAGLTYFCNIEGYAFNTVATLLPMTLNGYSSCFVSMRLKNHYSPKEIDTLKGYRYKIPTVDEAVYDLFHWHKLYFTVYNCFELASIEDRSLFKSQVDLMIATELNRDTNYFSEIAGSWVRDIHAFFVQVNTSEYGDSRIMKPSSKDTRNMVVVTGGENSTVLVEDLDVKGLRDYELKEYNLQEKDKTYKMTPPDFDHDKVLSRIHDEEMY